jgi:hypothetical protein
VRPRRTHTRILAPLALGLCVWLVWPTQAFARALVRFIHGVPGVGLATVKVNTGGGDENLGSIAFGQSTQWRGIRSGSFRWTLVGAGKPLASGTASVGDGAYDIVVLERSSKPWLGIYKAEGGKPGTSLVRVIHGAPELGSPELTLDGKQAVKSLSYTKATPYLSVNPGAHSLGAMRPGDTAPLVPAGAHVKLTPDVSYSAIVLGTRGQPVRVVALTDRGAPLTRSKAKSTPGTSATSKKAAKPKPKAKAAPSMPSSHAPASESDVIEVKPGDSLWSIARSLVGANASNEAIERKLVAIWDLNSRRIGTGDPNLIFVGTRLRIPK